MNILGDFNFSKPSATGSWFIPEGGMSTPAYPTTGRTGGTGRSSGSLIAPQLDLDTILGNSREAAARIAASNINGVAATTDAALASTVMAGNRLTEQSSAAFYTALNKVLPNWKSSIIGTGEEAVSKTRAMASELMTGQVPQDVQDAIAKTNAENGIGRGVFGQALKYNNAAAIGKTSLDMKTAGASMYSGVVSPLATSLLNNAIQLQPKPIDYTSIFNNTNNTLMTRNTVDASTGANEALQTAIYNADAQWARSGTLFSAGQRASEMAIASRTAERNYQLSQKAQQSQQSSNLMMMLLNRQNSLS